jgi:hypothetical protein
MKDHDVERVLALNHPVASVLLQRGGWLRATSMQLDVQFPADDQGPALWRVSLWEPEADKPWHSVYLLAETIVGISCVRTQT